MTPVENGMWLFDSLYGPEWVDRIDLSDFDIDDPRRCPVAQVTGLQFRQGLEALNNVGLAEYYAGISNETGPEYYGFCVVDDEYAALQQSWLEAVAIRKSER